MGWGQGQASFARKGGGRGDGTARTPLARQVSQSDTKAAACMDWKMGNSETARWVAAACAPPPPLPYSSPASLPGCRASQPSLNAFSAPPTRCIRIQDRNPAVHAACVNRQQHLPLLGRTILRDGTVGLICWAPRAFLRRLRGQKGRAHACATGRPPVSSAGRGTPSVGFFIKLSRKAARGLM